MERRRVDHKLPRALVQNVKESLERCCLRCNTIKGLRPYGIFVLLFRDFLAEHGTSTPLPIPTVDIGTTDFIAALVALIASRALCASSNSVLLDHDTRCLEERVVLAVPVQVAQHTNDDDQSADDENRAW